MNCPRVIVVGAGVGGLVAATQLAANGLEVVVVERATGPGGKLREVAIGNARIDSGPTVFTLKSVFEEIFAAAGTSLDRHLSLTPVEILARHAWREGEVLDLFADVDRSVDAIGAFAGPAAARGYADFCRRSRRVYEALDAAFIRQHGPSLPGLVLRLAPTRPADLVRISPFTTLWRAMRRHFEDPRLRQLFGRYATYCGSSPLQSPATLMLVAHVEQSGVWLIDGGMYRLAEALVDVGRSLGVDYRFGCPVATIESRSGRVGGVRLATGERLDADHVVVNADTAALAAGLFGPEAGRVVPRVGRSRRSLSALTWSLVAETEGFPLSRHTVFFGDDYASEFVDIFRRGRLPAKPTVYVCAQDRDDRGRRSGGGTERLFCIVNAPANGDEAPLGEEEIAACERQVIGLMRRSGLRVRARREDIRVTTPTEFERLFPATGGALYGRASHGWRASFQRPAPRTRFPGLYLAGGSTHPGPGVPMAALSGRMAAACLLQDLASTAR